MLRLLDHVNQQLLTTENRKPYVYPEPRVNPSQLSAYKIDNRRNAVAGACGLTTWFKLIGEAPTEPMKPETARIFRTGRFFEDEIAGMLKKTGLYAASGVRTYLPDLIMSLELDIIAIDPETKQGIIVENKTIKGEWMAKQVNEGHPKAENLMQICMYLDIIRTGAKLKDLIYKGVAEKEVSLEFGDFTMNRIDADLEVVASIDDGPVTGKLLYQDRETCGSYELDISLYKDPTTGLTYPKVNGIPYPEFTLESVYARRREIQRFWADKVLQAKKTLLGMGIEEPQPSPNAFGDPDYRNPEYLEKKKLYWEKIGEYLRNLPPSEWPQADYEYRYSSDKLAFLQQEGLLSRTETTKMKKGERIGDFNCDYCDFKKKCVAARYPEYRHQFAEVTDFIQ